HHWSELSLKLPGEPCCFGELLFERYEVLYRVGAGGQGVAYLCRDIETGNEVLAKVNQGSSSGILNSFQNEARLTKTLRHPSIPRFLSYGDDPLGRQILIRQYVRGMSLRTQLDKGPLSPEKACHILIQILNALEA